MRTTNEILRVANDQILSALKKEIKPINNSRKISELEKEISEAKNKMGEEISLLKKQYAENRFLAIKFFQGMGFSDIESFHGSPADFSERYCYLKNSLKNHYYNLTQAGKGLRIRDITESYEKKISELKNEINDLKAEKPTDINELFKLHGAKTIRDAYYSSRISKELHEEIEHDHITSHEIGEKCERFGCEITPHKITFSDGSYCEWDDPIWDV